MNSYMDMQSVVKELYRDIHEATEKGVLDQLNDFVKRGLIVVEMTQPVLVQDMHSTEIKIQQYVKLTLKDKEYIEKLEKENQEMKDLLETIETNWKDTKEVIYKYKDKK